MYSESITRQHRRAHVDGIMGSSPTPPCELILKIKRIYLFLYDINIGVCDEWLFGLVKWGKSNIVSNQVGIKIAYIRRLVLNKIWCLQK